MYWLVIVFIQQIFIESLKYAGQVKRFLDPLKGSVNIYFLTVYKITISFATSEYLDMI